MAIVSAFGMILSDVSFGIFAFLPQGWIFMAFVITIECLIMAKYLAKKFYDKRIYIITTISNLVSGISGIIISMILNGGWYLVVWFPWLSSNEINLQHKKALIWLAIFYAAAFVLSIIIEGIFNIFTLRRDYSIKGIVISTLLANIISYTVGTFVLYSYSFGLIH